MILFPILFVLAVWVSLLFVFGYVLTFPLKKRWIRVTAGVAVAVVLFTLPMRDEIKGKEEFEALCRVGGVYQISPQADGKKFDLKSSYSEKMPLTGYARPVEEVIVTYTDIATDEVVATAKAYIAKGGWLVRRGWLMNSGGGDGAFLGRPQCFPGDSPEQAHRLHAITNKIVN